MHNRITYHSTNYYLIPCDGGFMVVDAGWWGCLPVFLKKLRALDVQADQIRYIFLTHHHHDHAALVEELKRLTGARLIVHRRQLPYLTQGITNYQPLKQYNGFLWLADRLSRPFVRYKYPPVTLSKNDIVIDCDVDDHTLRSLGIQGKILLTPGHSSDSVSVLLDDGNAYVGDLVMNMGSMKLLGKIPFPIEAESYAEVHDSLCKLIHAGAVTLHPSHGNTLTSTSIAFAIVSNSETVKSVTSKPMPD